jgi:hypothetical protein
MVSERMEEKYGYNNLEEECVPLLYTLSLSLSLLLFSNNNDFQCGSTLCLLIVPLEQLQ